MHIQIRVVSLLVLLFSFSGPIYGQISNPIAEPIIKRGLNVEIREVEGDGPRLVVDGRHVQGLNGALGYGGTLRALGIGLCADRDEATTGR